ncbi:MAG: DMT family transporter [Acidobacteria bacterium]|nr:DMT family transporter [Acidobacteriota bacterium]
MSASRFGGLDFLLILVIVAWGTNLSVIKVALREFPVHAFNALRMLLAGAAFAVVLWRMRPERRRVAPADRGRVVFLGLMGGTSYQMLFVSGVPATSVANAGLIFGLTPVVVSLFSSMVGHEELPWTRWAGGVLSVIGLYFVVGAGAAVTRNSLIGDALIFAAMLCWSAYSVASRPMLGRYSPTMLTAWAAIIAVPLYLVFAVPSLAATNWAGVSWWSWTLMTWSSIFCLVLAYVIWYTGVQRLGATRTSAYSNLTPIAAMAVAWLWLGEAVTVGQGVGAAAILGGVFMTRRSPVVLKPL